MKKCKNMIPPPKCDQIKRASKDVAWEYAAMLGAALEMAKGSWEGFCSPMNHFVQEAFLTHVRNLAEFFRKGARGFKTAQGPPPRPRDNIYAVDFCFAVGWQSKPFDYNKKLIKAINKTLSHPTYSRDHASQGHVHFEGYEHVHGTVKLMRQTWADFMKSVNHEFLQPQCPEDIPYWLAKHTVKWRVEFKDLENEFEKLAHQLVRDRNWKLNQTPDGLV
jgi:hypothetical protein